MTNGRPTDDIPRVQFVHWKAAPSEDWRFIDNDWDAIPLCFPPWNAPCTWCVSPDVVIDPTVLRGIDDGWIAPLSASNTHRALANLAGADHVAQDDAPFQPTHPADPSIPSAAESGDPA